MQFAILATVLGLAASSMAVKVRGETSSPEKNNGSCTIELCNDFHFGKPCETQIVYPNLCVDVDAKLYKYISSVDITDSQQYCNFWNKKDCCGDRIFISYPGSKDLAVDYNFDNQISSYRCNYY